MKYLECHLESENGISIYYIDGVKVNRAEFLKVLKAVPENSVNRLAEDIKIIRNIVEKNEKKEAIDCSSYEYPTGVIALPVWERDI